MISTDRINQLISKGNQVLSTHKPNPPRVIGFPTLDSKAFRAWQSQTINFLQSNLPTDNTYLTSFKDQVDNGYRGSVDAGIGILESLKEDVELGAFEMKDIDSKPNPIEPLLNIFERFHQVSRQLRSRHDGRDTLFIDDEYDVQDLLHSLFHLHFDDIRPEEWTPSYAGKSSRMDFLLKDYHIVVEVKKTRKGLGAKEVGSQLIEDIERYRSHPNTEALICFVYDPEGLVGNPRGLENDLNRETDELNVKVLIRP